MSTVLYRIGRLAYTKPWYFIVSWVALLVIILTGVLVNGVKLSNEMSLPGMPSQKVLDSLNEELPGYPEGFGRIVFVAPEGEKLTEPDNTAAIASALQNIAALDQVIDPAEEEKTRAEATAQALADAQAAASAAVAQQGGDAAAQQEAAAQVAAEFQAKQDAQLAAMSKLPYGPLMADPKTPVPGVLVSRDGGVALANFSLTQSAEELDAAQLDAIMAAATKAVDDTGITVLRTDSLAGHSASLELTEIIGLGLAALILLLTLGSLVAAGLPIGTALIGVGIGLGATFALSQFVNVNSSTPAFATMIGLAVGIDYALFVLNRHRRLIVQENLTAVEAMARAVGTAGNAVVFAGVTVIIALSGLAVIGMDFLTVMALSAALTVAIAVAIAVSLLPALLGLVGERICSPAYRARQRARIRDRHATVAHRYVDGVIRRKWLVITGAVALLGVLAIPVTSMRLDLPSGASSNIGTDTRDSYDAITRGFGEGFNGTIIAVANRTDGEGFTPEQIDQLTGTLSQVPGVASAVPQAQSEDKTFLTFAVISTAGPTDDVTRDLIADLRDPEVAKDDQVSVGVTGQTAIALDLADRLASVLPKYIAIIGILSLIILILVFRSILVPLKATLGFVLSLVATLGATTAVYQWGWLKDLVGIDNGGPLMSFLPVLVTGILFGLAMDYEMFLVSSMRESYVHGQRGSAAVRHGFEVSARVVVAAAAIMVAVFAGFIFAHDIFIRQMGFALAIGVLLDAFVVRLALVPAVMAVLGDRAWWFPRWMDRSLPNLDVEGESLVAQLREADADAEPALGDAKRKSRPAAQRSGGSSAGPGSRTATAAGASAIKPKKKRSSAKKKAKKKKRRRG